MAEKYGKIPPRFTKAWWDYFWMYYKVHVIAIAFALILIVITVVQVVNEPKYDTTLMYAGPLAFPEEIAERITKEASPLCEDVDNNGEKSLNFYQLNMSDDDPEYSYAMSQKLYLTLAADEIYLYALDADIASSYLEDSSSEGVFVSIDKWYNEELPDDAVISHNGIAFGVKLTECEVFKEIAKEYDADLSDTYLFMRYYPREDQEKQIEGYNAAKKLAARLVG